MSVERRWPDAQPHLPDAEYLKRGAEFDDRTTGIEVTKWSYRWLYVVDTTSANRSVVLPAAKDSVDIMHVVKRISGGANTCVVSSDSGNLDGTASYSVATQYASVSFVSDGDDWWAV